MLNSDAGRIGTFRILAPAVDPGAWVLKARGCVHITENPCRASIEPGIGAKTSEKVAKFGAATGRSGRGDIPIQRVLEGLNVLVLATKSIAEQCSQIFAAV
jgi:hypothetical protein